MGCGSCGTKGCNSGGCSTGGCASCNKMNTFDWLTNLAIEDVNTYQFIEVSFKKGARKHFYKHHDFIQVTTGDMVVVEADSGFDIGQVSLCGELVRIQMLKKGLKEDSILQKVIRRANERDLEKLEEARSMEHNSMIRSRIIARELNLDMKIGDVEYQGDKRKATFFYTADGRVDFRELIRLYAREFSVKIEMRQIGARQESARIGGIGSCGRELCCSTWLSDFKTVSTSAARYQNLAINQSKLSGMCGRLKCCLNFELESYLEALEGFPKHADILRAEIGEAQLLKVDIFKGIMFYSIRNNDQMRGKFFALPKENVVKVLEMNKKGQKPFDFSDLIVTIQPSEADEETFDYDSVNEVIDELPPDKRKKRRVRKNKNRPPAQRNRTPAANSDKTTKEAPKNPNGNAPRQNKPRSRNRRNRGRKNSNPNTDKNE